MTTTMRRASVALLLALPLALTACSGDSEPKETAAAASTSSSAARETAPSRATDEPDTGSGAKGDGDITAFCTEGKAATDELSAAMSGFDPNTADASALQGVSDQLDTAVTRLESVTAPAEIAADWQTLTGAMRTLSDSVDTMVTSATGGDLTAVTQAMTEMTEIMQDEAVTAASTAVSTFNAANC